MVNMNELREKHKDNGILLEKAHLLNLSKGVMRMAENDPELLNTVYKEVSEKLGMDTATYAYIGRYVRFARAHGGHSAQADSAHEVLQNSWLYRQIAEWYNNHSHKLSDKTRSCFMNLSLGNF